MNAYQMSWSISFIKIHKHLKIFIWKSGIYLTTEHWLRKISLFQNTIYEWVRDHRVHHKYSETDADPHNANRGFFFAHVGWLMMRKHPDVIEKGRKVDMSDVTNDPVVQFHEKWVLITFNLISSAILRFAIFLVIQFL